MVEPRTFCKLLKFCPIYILTVRNLPLRSQKLLTRDIWRNWIGVIFFWLNLCSEIQVLNRWFHKVCLGQLLHFPALISKYLNTLVGLRLRKRLLLFICPDCLLFSAKRDRLVSLLSHCTETDTGYQLLIRSVLDYISQNLLSSLRIFCMFCVLTSDNTSPHRIEISAICIENRIEPNKSNRIEFRWIVAALLVRGPGFDPLSDCIYIS